MDTRLIASLFWLLGTLAIGGAILGPFLDNMIRVQPLRSGIEQKIKNIVDAQNAYFSQRERYYYFSTDGKDQDEASKILGTSVRDPKFVLDAVPGAKGPLVIRAYTSPGAANQDNIPPMLYRFEFSGSAKDAVKGEWVTLSGAKPGLLGLLGLN